MSTIRAERTFEQYSRGAELCTAITAMWESNRRLPAGSNDIIASRIASIMNDYDLTLQEWHYWCKAVNPVAA